MSARGLIPRAAALFLLVAFITAPQLFAFAFRPLTVNNAPAIYDHGSLLSLTLSHLRTCSRDAGQHRAGGGSASSSRGPRARNSCRCRAAS